MNKLVSLFLVAALLSAALTGCKKDKPASDEPGNIPVNLKTGIAPTSATKVANDQWETSTDKVGLYMKKAGQPLSAAGAIYTDAGNREMSIAGDGSLVATPEIMYPAKGNVDFIAYYPYTSSVSSDFTIPVNVAAEQAAGLPTPTLYSNDITNQAPTEAAVTLNFMYAVAKVEVTVTGGNNSPLTAADFAAMTVTVDGLYSQATLQLANGALSNMSNKQTVTLYQKSYTATSATFEMLALPSGEEVTFTFNVGGEQYSHKMTANYVAAKLHRLPFALDFPAAKMLLLGSYIVPFDADAPVPGISVNCGDDEGDIEMVFVQGGEFTMGRDDVYSYTEHQVTVSSFKIGKYEITQGQWEAVMGSNPSYFQKGANYPVETVSWNDIVGTSGLTMEINGITYYADGFIYKLNTSTGKQYRLPTEAEWEYAARGGIHSSDGYAYSGSNTVDDVAWYWGSIPSQTSGTPGYGTQPVGTKLANQLGIHDMSGNVWEWCSDLYEEYTSGAITDPTGAPSGSNRVVRGGSWYIDGNRCRVARRASIDPADRYDYLGFRVVMP